MRKHRFSEEQIIGMLRDAEAGGQVEEICRREGVSRETFYRWRRKYGGMEVSDARRLKQFEKENRRLKRIVADPVGISADPRPTPKRRVDGEP